MRLFFVAAAVVASFSVSAGSAVAQTLSPPERAMVASVDRQAAEGQTLLQQLVEINSGTMNLAGVRAVGDVLRPRFEALGFKVQWVNQDEVRRAGHLVATHACAKPGACGRRMLLIGHMDTVFEKTSAFQHWTVDGNTATGPGTNDMKGGLVIMLMALKAMQDAGVLKNADITVVLSGDEEDHGKPATVSRRDMIDAAHHADLALEFEGTPKMGDVYYGSVSRRSSIGWEIHTTGKTGHSSGIFSAEMGDGAIYELTRILDEFRRTLPEDGLTFNVGLIGGGSAVTPVPGGGLTVNGKVNIVPPVAVAHGDIRTLTDEQSARVEAKMRTIVAAHLPQTGAQISFEEGYPAMAPTEANRMLLKELNGANAALGFAAMPELDPMKRGAGDISFVAKIVPGLAGVGATGLNAHAPGETLDLPSQVVNAKRDAVLMYRLSLDR